MKLIDAWIWAEKMKMLCEKKSDKVLLGSFPTLRRFTQGETPQLFVSKTVLEKLRKKHKIKNGVEFVRKLLNNHEFAARYEEDKRVINFYRKWTTKSGKECIFTAGIAIKDRVVTTCYPPTTTKYNEAYNKRI